MLKLFNFFRKKFTKKCNSRKTDFLENDFEMSTFKKYYENNRDKCMNCETDNVPELKVERVDSEIQTINYFEGENSAEKCHIKNWDTVLEEPKLMKMSKISKNEVPNENNETNSDDGKEKEMLVDSFLENHTSSNAWNDIIKDQNNVVEDVAEAEISYLPKLKCVSFSYCSSLLEDDNIAAISVKPFGDLGTMCDNTEAKNSVNHCTLPTEFDCKTENSASINSSVLVGEDKRNGIYSGNNLENEIIPYKKVRGTSFEDISLEGRISRQRNQDNSARFSSPLEGVDLFQNTDFDSDQTHTDKSKQYSSENIESKNVFGSTNETNIPSPNRNKKRNCLNMGVRYENTSSMNFFKTLENEDLISDETESKLSDSSEWEQFIEERINKNLIEKEQNDFNKYETVDSLPEEKDSKGLVFRKEIFETKLSSNLRKVEYIAAADENITESTECPPNKANKKCSVCKATDKNQIDPEIINALKKKYEKSIKKRKFKWFCIPRRKNN